MNTQVIDGLSAAFSALADPTRRAILAKLALGETRVGDLVKPFAISGPAISRHLRVLENARLIERKVDAQWRICRLRPAGLRVANDWLSRYEGFWEQSLDRLAEVLEKDRGQTAPATPASSTTPAAGRPETGTRRERTFKSVRPATRKRRSP